MHDGFDITFREVMPESSLIELVVEQLAQLHDVPGAHDRHCSVELRRLAGAPHAFDAHVQFEPERRGPALHGEASGPSAHEALCRAFADLLRSQLLH